MIQATIPAGMISWTVHGLHQWDYGQQLQLQADGLPDLVEVHFGCPGMKEAEVRVAPLVDGAVTVSIPDRCLEQSAPITAWVYFVNDASGRTALELTLPVIPRLKPSAAGSAELEEEAGNKYDQLFALMGEAYDAIEACKNVEANADEAQALANAAASSASQASTASTEAAASATAAKASADAVQAVVETTLANSLTKERSLIEVGSGPTNTDLFATETIPTEKAFFYAFFIDTTSNTTVSLGFFLWKGTDTVEIPAPVGSFGLRVTPGMAGSRQTGYATILETQWDGNTVEFTPRPSTMKLYLQRLSN